MTSNESMMFLLDDQNTKLIQSCAGHLFALVCVFESAVVQNVFRDFYMRSEGKSGKVWLRIFGLNVSKYI